MAYISQDQKNVIAPVVKKILKKYGLKGSLSTPHGSSLKLTIRSGSIDFKNQYEGTLDNTSHVYIQVNHYYIEDYFSGAAATSLIELKNAMNMGNWNNSRPEIDHFDVGWYINIHIGKWDKPYQYITK